MPEVQESTFESLCELEDRTIEAILLGFNEPLHPLDKEYVIPSPRRIQDFVGKVIRDTNLQRRIKEGWKRITMRGVAGPEQSTNCLEDYYMPIFGPSKLDWRWFPGSGDLFKFREGEREKAEERAKYYWTTSEINDFLKISVLTQKMAIEHYKNK